MGYVVFGDEKFENNVCGSLWIFFYTFRPTLMQMPSSISHLDPNYELYNTTFQTVHFEKSTILDILHNIVRRTVMKTKNESSRS